MNETESRMTYNQKENRHYHHISLNSKVIRNIRPATIPSWVYFGTILYFFLFILQLFFPFFCDFICIFFLFCDIICFFIFLFSDFICIFFLFSDFICIFFVFRFFFLIICWCSSQEHLRRHDSFPPGKLHKTTTVSRDTGASRHHGAY